MMTATDMNSYLQELIIHILFVTLTSCIEFSYHISPVFIHFIFQKRRYKGDGKKRERKVLCVLALFIITEL